MKNEVQCPQCSSVASWVSRKPYCPKCGWNLEAVRRHVQRLKTASLAGLFFGPAMMLLVGWMTDIPRVFIYIMAGVACVFPVLGYVGLHFLHARLLGITPTAPPVAEPGTEEKAERSVSTSPAAITGPTVTFDGQQIPVALPRRAGLNRSGRVTIGMMVGVLGIFEAVFVSQVALNWETLLAGIDIPGRLWVMAIGSVLIPLISYVSLREFRRQRRLIASGELTMARVIRQRGGGNGRNSQHYIEYEYKDFVGRKVSKTAMDFTRSLYEGMEVPVVYDRQNAEDSLPICASYYRIQPENPA